MIFQVFPGNLAAIERKISSPAARLFCERSRQYQVSSFCRKSGRASHKAETTVRGPEPKSRQMALSDGKHFSSSEEKSLVRRTRFHQVK